MSSKPAAFPRILERLKERAAGDYSKDKFGDTLNSLKWCGLWDPVHGIPQDKPGKIWRRLYMPLVSSFEFKFHSVADFLYWHYPFASQYPQSGRSSITFDAGGKHTECRVRDGQWRGCDLCELLYFLDRQVYGDGVDVTDMLLEFAMERDYSCHRRFGQTVLLIDGRLDDEGRVVSFKISGELHRLDWQLWNAADDRSTLGGSPSRMSDMSDVVPQDVHATSEMVRSISPSPSDASSVGDLDDLPNVAKDSDDEGEDPWAMMRDANAAGLKMWNELAMNNNRDEAASEDLIEL
ncbi:hypothetical protein LTR37_015279 [Vermiconidia calcicola]|uniref:Uncharacterized protein n=1 Tax=Vermiconidia calcicola TaxID=1690605 RepID=A0ACC3MSM0_9PEZI|nr:hypothetical protein LTR37_015279 [Vermiconidia calcicola]